jgi:hypothetical protein
MPDIDETFIDVHFPDFDEYTFGDLGVSFCANYGQSYEDRFGVLSDAEIDAAIEAIDAAGGGIDQLVTRIYNQKNEGSCVANATSQAHEVVQARQFGKDRVVPLSAISLYKRIGRSPNSGAMVSDGWAEMKARGILPLDTPENRARFGDRVMPNTGFSTRYPAGWEAVAAQFAGLEATIIRSVGGILTALCNQDPVVVGREGHSICYVRPMRKNGRRVVKYANSWGNWGDNGYGYDSENQIKKSAGWAFALRSVTIPNAA